MFDWIIDHIPWWGWLIIVGVPASVIAIYFAPIWNALPRWLKTLILFIGALALAFLGGRYRGRANAEEEERARNAEALQKRQEVDNEIAQMSDKDVRDRLDRWTRD
jgi:membrane protein implicated in regulation of membrane protease activity